jgi:aspartate/tyrosine/aromatic aminotransferase
VFDHVKAAPPDAILGLVERFVADPNPDKLDLTVGVYRDETGKTPIFEAVRTAEFRFLENETTKSYLPIDGPAAFGDCVGELLFGGPAPSGLVARTTQTPGGTGALAVAGHFLAGQRPGSTVWISTPTWPNHKPIFAVSGLQVAEYRYYDPSTRELLFDAMLADLGQVAAGDTVVLHGCCHNPTGRDLDLDQWGAVADLLAEKGATAIIDAAYLGLADGIEADRGFLAPVTARGIELLVCTSFSKNLGLYRERVGGLTASEAGLTALTGIADERGMFCLTGISAAQAEQLRTEQGIYLLNSGRANVAALDEATIPRVVEALRSVLA